METITQNLTDFYDSIDIAMEVDDDSLEKEKFFFKNLGLTKKVACSYCKLMCRSKVALKNHIVMHKTKKPFVCENCKFGCSSKSYLKLRAKKRHDGDSIRDDDGKSIAQSKPKVVETRNPGGSPERLLKPACKKIENGKLKLQSISDDGNSSLNSKHRAQSTKTKESRKEKSGEEKIAEFKVNDLKIIGNIDDLRDHFGKYNESGKEFKIEIFRNTSDGRLQCHLLAEKYIKKHGSKASDFSSKRIDGSKRKLWLKCQVCGFSSKNKYVLRRHKLIQNCKSRKILASQVVSNDQQTISKPFKCKDCDFSCKNKFVFRRHELIQHVTEKPFQCQTCDFKTTTSGGLKRHVKKHNS